MPAPTPWLLRPRENAPLPQHPISIGTVCRVYLPIELGAPAVQRNQGPGSVYFTFRVRIVTRLPGYRYCAAFAPASLQPMERYISTSIISPDGLYIINPEYLERYL